MGRSTWTWVAAAIAWMVVAGCGGGVASDGQAPEITSAPPATATVGVPFVYTITATGITPIGYGLVSGPEGMRIDRETGLVDWTPTAIETESVTVMATNIAGTDTQMFEVVVEARNGPVFTSTPPSEATVATQYAYDPEVIASGPVSWSAPEAPEGLTIDERSGAVRWTPAVSQVGQQRVTIRATEDDGGAFADQDFAVLVSDSTGPAVITSTPPASVFRGETWTYDAVAAGSPTIQWRLITPSSGTPAQGVSIVTNPPEGRDVTVAWETAGVAPGDYTMALEVHNGIGSPSVQEFTVTVEPRPPVPIIDVRTVPPPATVFVGSPYRYDVNLTPASDSPGVVWSIAEDSLVPADLAITVDPSSGEVVFTASEARGEIQYGYAVRATNALGEFDEATITVEAVLPPATPALIVTPGTRFTLEVGQGFPGASASATGVPAPSLSTTGTVPDFVAFEPLTGLLSASSTKPAPDVGDIGTHTFDIVATNTEGEDSAAIEIMVVAAPPGLDSIIPAAGRRQSDVPVVVRGAGFVAEADPTIVLSLGDYTESLETTFIDDGTLSATVPVDLTRPSGVYDVEVDQGSTTTLAKRFTVTEGEGVTLSGRVSTDMTLTALQSPYHVAGNLQIENGVTVTIEPGAVVMLDGGSDRRIDIGVDGAGAITADGGTPGVGDQIVFTRFQAAGGPAPSGHYRGLLFGVHVITAHNVLRNTVIEFGGRRGGATNQGAVEVRGSAPTIVDSVIRESLNYGLFARVGTASPATDWFTGNRLTRNARSPISIEANDVSTLGGDLDLIGNGQDRVFVRTSTVQRPSAPWTDHGVPFFLNQGLVVRNDSVMTLDAGIELRFGSNRRLQVSAGSERGTLIAAGSAEAPIRMVPDTGSAGDWNGIVLNANTGTSTVLRHVRVQEFSGSQTGGLRVEGAREAIVENCLFQSTDTGSVGVYLSSTGRLASFENNVLDVAGMSVSAPLGGFSDVLKATNTYESPLRVRASTAAGLDLVWAHPTASDASTQPIRPTGNLAVVDGSLTIAAGTLVQMPTNGQLDMNESQLLVEGTVSSPVVFATAPSASFWNRIRLRGQGGNGISRIRHAVLDTAGSDPSLDADPRRAALLVEVHRGVAATPAISGTTITNSQGYGVVFSDQTHCGGQCADNTVVGSRFSAVRMHGNFIGRFGTGNELAGNNTSSTLGHEGVWVAGDRIDVGATWPANDVPYVVQGDLELRQDAGNSPVPVLTIDPGAELRFAENRRLRVGDGGDGILDAQGDPSHPITFTTLDAATPVHWRGIFLGQGSDGSVLDAVTVSFGGRNDNTGNVNFLAGSLVTIGAVSFTDSDNYAGVIFDGGSATFAGSPASRVYSGNGFDCILDVRTRTCEPL